MREWHRRINPFHKKRKLSFLDQPASGALGRNAIAIEKSDCFQVFFFLLERTYSPAGLERLTVAVVIRVG
jgi:hypothetical protein